MGSLKNTQNTTLVSKIRSTAASMVSIQCSQGLMLRQIWANLLRASITVPKEWILTELSTCRLTGSTLLNSTSSTELGQPHTQLLVAALVPLSSLRYPMDQLDTSILTTSSRCSPHSLRRISRIHSTTAVLKCISQCKTSTTIISRSSSIKIIRGRLMEYSLPLSWQSRSPRCRGNLKVQEFTIGILAKPMFRTKLQKYQISRAHLNSHTMHPLTAKAILILILLVLMEQIISPW